VTRETGFVPSRLRPGVCLDHESHGEFAFIMRAELDPRVTSIWEQPLELKYRHPSGTRRTVIDFCITVDGQCEWHEVKSDKKLADPEELERLWWIAKALKDRGHRYSVAARSDLIREPEFEHLQDVFRRFQSRVKEDLWSRIDLALEAGPATIEELLERTVGHGATFETFLALLCQRRMTADIAGGVTLATTVYPAGSVTFPRLIPFRSPLEMRP
jgi:hypothetical protein